MCGITGWIDWERDLRQQEPTLLAMARTLAKRGPDAEGTFVTERAALAHRRLIVLDPEGGKQPMTCRYGERTYAITYNGELYNFVELRRELADLGHRFETRSDTEVLLRAYVQWGTGCLSRLNGIFAFGIWDDAEQRLVLARDHLGVKPLYYAQRGSAVLFGSEIKAILANPLFPPEVTRDGLAEVCAMGPFRLSGEVFRGIKDLRAAHCVVVGREGVRVERYWTLRNAPHTETLEETTRHIRGLLEDTVKRQLVADVPVAFLLSGGLDSSGTTAIGTQALRAAGEPVRPAFTVDVKGDDQHFKPDHMHRDRDPEWARRVADHLGIRLGEVMLDTSELVEHALEPMRARDLPSAGDIETSLLLLCRRIKPEATVLLSGESADEVFGGYPWFYNEQIRAKDTFPWMPPNYGQPLFAPEAVAWLRPAERIAACYREALAEVPRTPGEDPAEAKQREIFYLFLNYFLTFLLDRKDRMSMAASVEVRVPFCDHRLVQYVWNVPWAMKYVGGVEKGLLRKAFEGLLPADVLARRKTAYPRVHNPAYVEAMRSEVRRILDDANSPLQPLLNQSVLRPMVEPNAPANEGFFGVKLLLESVFQLHHWMREYKVAVV